MLALRTPARATYTVVRLDVVAFRAFIVVVINVLGPLGLRMEGVHFRHLVALLSSQPFGGNCQAGAILATTAMS